MGSGKAAVILFSILLERLWKLLEQSEAHKIIC